MINLISETLPFVCISSVLDTFFGVFVGIITGLGKQKYASIAYLVAFLMIGFPVSLFLAFKLGYDLIGLWLGLITGMGILNLMNLVYILTLDWYKIAREVIAKLEQESDKMTK